MKLLRYICILLAIATAQAFQSCDDEGPVADTGAVPDSFNLEVSVPLVGSRAADDNLNEFTVSKQLHLYFFRADGHDDEVSEYAYDAIVYGGFEVSRQLRFSLPDNALKEGGLFGSSANTCYVYAVANVGEQELTARTVNGLKATVVGSKFDYTRPQPSFAMDGFSTLTLDRSNRIVTGTIHLQRAAAKLSLSVDLPESITVEETIENPNDGTEEKVTYTYHSRPADMHVWIANGVKNSRLNTAPVEETEGNLYSNEITVASEVGSSFTFDDSQPKYKYLQDVPFYSYPNKWDPTSPRGNCYLTLEIPWSYTDKDGKPQNIVTYYRLSVQPGKNCIERNTFYDMRVTIGRLGGTIVQQPVDMLFDWNYGMQWNMQTLPTDIKEIRYLLLNNNDFSTTENAYVFTMDNEETISIPYNTSHPVEIESVQMTWRDYLNNADRSITLTPVGGSGNYHYDTYDGYAVATNFAGITIDPANALLHFKRDMVHVKWDDSNRAQIQSTENALNSYTFTIKLRHTDATPGDPSSHSTVVITQYPAIYIMTQYTSDANMRWINNNNTTYRTNIGTWWNPVYVYKGYLNNNNTSTSSYYIGSIHNDSNVKNKNTYIITISKFDNGASYIIADPRKRTVDNLNESGTSATATATWSVADGAGNELRYYYPADDDATKQRFIAPQFRVASQWGVTFDVTRRGAERRCASYQEDGRPAGRWRLPTPAEIEFICDKSSKQYIPYLFGTAGNTANYWCSTGGVNVDNSKNTVTVVTPGADATRAVRCVYDEWYWKDDTLTNKTQFRWGDRQRTTNGN